MATWYAIWMERNSGRLDYTIRRPGILTSMIQHQGTNSSTYGFYKNIVTKGKQISVDEWDNMFLIPSEDEIKHILFVIPDEKSPGPDGYTSCFFKKGWEIVKGDLVIVVKDFFQNGQLLKFYAPEFLSALQISSILPSLLSFKCITTPSYSIVLNGQPHGYFKGQRGLRQGDPISPLLFTLCMEYLSRVLDEVCSLPGFKFHPLCKGLKLVHLIFNDDLLIFCKGDLRSVVSIMEVFKCFSAASRLQISSKKSDIIFNGIEPSLAVDILEYTGFTKGSLPFKYLGVKISHKRLSKLDCNNIVDKMVARIRGWNCRKICYTGRLVLNVLCKSKKSGGVGLVDSQIWNTAAIGKLVWWILSKKDLLWIKWIDNIYLKGRSLMNYTPTSYISWSWSKICEVKDKIKAGYVNDKWKGGDAEYTIGSCYNWLRPKDPCMVPWYTEVWNMLNIPKHNFILWLIKQGRLLTLDRLHRMGITDEHVCYICGVADESHSHLFQDCEYTKKYYALLFDWVQLQVSGLVNASKFLRMRQLIGFGRLLISSLISIIQYRIWNIRNVCRHDGYVMKPERMIQEVKADCKMRLQGLTLGPLKHIDKLWCTNLGVL
ncbi:uncharacterized protein LOC141651402 [Silene latifolia]|uniref:uncharacterized protein LOC141651402 n=1 Tax=Silene latifolia TaxID=37657 RepID=UPI003D785870